MAAAAGGDKIAVVAASFRSSDKVFAGMRAFLCAEF
jgi:hypothetical protein